MRTPLRHFLQGLQCFDFPPRGNVMKTTNDSKSPSLKKDIFVTLTLKFIAMGIIWALCFSHPIEHELDTRAVSQHLLA
jgi:hypothetical protein